MSETKREWLGTTEDHGHFIPIDQVEPWMRDYWPKAVHVVEASALEDAQKEIAALKEDQDKWKTAAHKISRQDADLQARADKLVEALKQTFVKHESTKEIYNWGAGLREVESALAEFKAAKEKLK